MRTARLGDYSFFLLLCCCPRPPQSPSPPSRGRPAAAGVREPRDRSPLQSLSLRGTLSPIAPLLLRPNKRLELPGEGATAGLEPRGGFRVSAGPPAPSPGLPPRGARINGILFYFSLSSRRCRARRQQPPAARGGGCRGSGRNSAKLTPSPSKQTKAPAGASSWGQARRGRGPGDWRPGRAGRGAGTGRPQLATRLPAAPTGPGSSGHKVSSGRAHSPSWWNCSSSSFRAVGRARAPRGGPASGAEAASRGLLPRGRVRRGPRRRRRSSLPLPDSPLLCSSGYTKGRPPSRSHTHARPLPAPRRPPSRRPRGPGPRARPRRPSARSGPAAPPARHAVGGPARAPPLHPPAR